MGDQKVLDRMVEKARQEQVFSREDTPLGRRVLAAFLYHAGLSYRRIEPFVDRSYEAVRQWFHRLKHLFEPDCQAREEVAVDETKIEIDGEEHYVWAAVDCETLEILAVDVSPGRSSLDSLLFLKDVLKRCRGRPLLRADRGPWSDWPLELLDCEYERETWGNRLLIEAWFGLFNYRTRRFWHRFPHRTPPAGPDRGSGHSPLSTMHRLTLTPLRPLMSLEGDSAPTFTATLGNDELEPFDLSDHLGDGPVVLAFYPAAFSPVCSNEMVASEEHIDEIEAAGATLVGVSADSPFALAAFADEHGLGFDLVSDMSGAAMEEYGVGLDAPDLGLYGIANRAVFVLDDEGDVVYEWVADDPTNEPDYDPVLEAVRAA